MSDVQVGQEFNRWTVIGDGGISKDRRRTWLCRCECGTQRKVSERYLKNSRSKSCGCIKAADLRGKKFGKLTAVNRYRSHGKSWWMCQCDCGNLKIARVDALLKGITRHCGCSPSNLVDPKIIKLRQCWHHMLYRCENKENHAYSNYGGRGISICGPWHSFEVFKEWALINGYKPTLTIDRISNEGNYEPCNCQWIPKPENSRKRRNIKLDKESVKTIRQLLETSIKQKEIAEMFDVPDSVVSKIKHGTRWAGVGE